MNNLMRRAKHIVCMFLMVHAIALSGQSRSDLRSMFVSAEGDILFEDYAEALPKYMSLLQMFPDNYNLYYRVGQCYLNTPGEKEKSIEWLENAVKNIDPDYRTGRLSQKGAPRDALYHLANAYRIANNFDMALETYELFLKDADTEKYDTAMVRFQMQSCHNARKMILLPADVEEINLGAPVNDRFSEFNPVVSADESTLLFTRELPFYDAIFWSRKEDGNWTEPVNMTPQLGVDQDYYTSSLSPDGRTLLMYRIDTYDGNIYMSRLNGDTWSQVEKLNGNINTKFWESHAAMSSDGKKIYFTSNRRESLGGLDIFVSARDSSGNWGPATNLGPEVNTVYNEETPFLTNNDSTLFFSSRGHYNIGGYDIFRSDLDKNGRWSTPVNIGYPLNTTDDDLFFTPLFSGNRGYFSKFSGDGQGRMDIYSCEIWSAQNPRDAAVNEAEMNPLDAACNKEGQNPGDEAVNEAEMNPLNEAINKAAEKQVTPDELAEEIAAADTFTLQSDSLPVSVPLPAVPDSTDTAINERLAVTDSPDLTEALLSGTEIYIEEQPAEITAADIKPLSTDITVRQAVEQVQGTAAEDHPDKSAGDDNSPEPAATLAHGTSQAEAAGNDQDNPQTTNSGKGCCLCWLLALTALLLFFLLWRRRKKKKENDIQQ